MRHSEFAAACKNGSLTLSALAHTHIAVSPLHRSLLLSLTHAVSLTIARPASRAPLLKLPKQMAATVFTRFSWSSLRKESGARVSFERGERRDSQPRWCRRRSRRWTRWSARRVPPLLWSRSSTRAGAACRPRFESARSRGATEFLNTFLSWTLSCQLLTFFSVTLVLLPSSNVIRQRSVIMKDDVSAVAGAGRTTKRESPRLPASLRSPRSTR